MAEWHKEVAKNSTSDRVSGRKPGCNYAAGRCEVAFRHTAELERECGPGADGVRGRGRTPYRKNSMYVHRNAAVQEVLDMAGGSPAPRDHKMSRCRLPRMTAMFLVLYLSGMFGGVLQGQGLKERHGLVSCTSAGR